MRLIRVLLLAIYAANAATTDSNQQYRDARYLSDTITSACRWDCGIFLPDHFWFCFESGERVLVGQTIAWRWEYDPAKMFTLRGTAVKLRYDRYSIWVVRTDGKEMRLHQDYSHQGFVKSCNAKAQASPQ